MSQDRQAALESASRLCLLEGGDHVGEGAVVDAPAILRSGAGQADGQMCLADARWAPQHHVLLALQEAKLGETVDLFALDRWLEGEIELPEGLHRRQARGAHSRLQAPVVAQADLSLPEASGSPRLAVRVPLSASDSTASAASSAPGSFRSASMVRSRKWKGESVCLVPSAQHAVGVFHFLVPLSLFSSTDYDMKKIRFLIKTCETEEYAKYFLSGKMYCNRVGHFRKMGDARGGDDHEGGIPVSPRAIYFSEYIEHMHVFCMYSGMYDTDDPPSSLDELEAQLRPSGKLADDFGKYAVVIRNSPEFFARFRNAISQQYLLYFGGVIRYYMDDEIRDWFRLELLNFPAEGVKEPTEIMINTTMPIGIRPAMSKRAKFGYQKEYRFIFDSTIYGRDDAFVFDLGVDLSDIAHPTSIADVRKTLRASYSS